MINSWREWHLPTLNWFFSAEQVTTIRSIPISVERRADDIIWHMEAKGYFTMKSGCHLKVQKKGQRASFCASSSFQVPETVWKLIWHLPVPLCPFWWRLAINSLVTKDNLFRRKCAQSNHCPICWTAPETVEHLLFGCG